DTARGSPAASRSWPLAGGYSGQGLQAVITGDNRVAMRTVVVSEKVRGSVHEAEVCWYDIGRWASWIDGLARVREASDTWPESGARVVWESGPAGRGTVTETVLSHEPLRGQTVEVRDDSISARQSVSFTPAEDQV